MPLFEHLKLFLRSSVNKVIVKSQIYEFSNFEEYEGQIHKEGLEEDSISAIGLYFPHVDVGIHGGAFHVTTQVHARCGNSRTVSESVQITTGTAVVVNNSTCLHHVGPLCGNGSRLVVAFFVLNPAHAAEVKGSDQIIVNMEKKAAYLLLQMEVAERICLPQHVREMIVEYVVGKKRVQVSFERFSKMRMKEKDTWRLKTISINRMD